MLHLSFSESLILPVLNQDLRIYQQDLLGEKGFEFSGKTIV
jgi:hypothetical protein